MHVYRVALLDGTVDVVEAEDLDDGTEETILFCWEPRNVNPIAPNATKRTAKRYPTSQVVACTRIS